MKQAINRQEGLFLFPGTCWNLGKMGGEAHFSLNPIGGVCMKQGRQVFGREIRRGPEKGRGWLALIRETAFGEKVARGMPNLRRGVVVSSRAGLLGSVSKCVLC